MKSETLSRSEREKKYIKKYQTVMNECYNQVI